MSAKLVIALIVAVVLVYGGYRVLRHFSKPKPAAMIQTVSPTPQASPSGAMTNQMKVTLSEVNKSGQSGSAVLSEANGKTTVTVTLAGFTKGVSQPAHIHVGACPGVGAIKYPLTNVVDGSSITVLNATLSDIKANLPLALNVHKSENEISVYTACGNLPSQ